MLRSLALLVLLAFVAFIGGSVALPPAADADVELPTSPRPELPATVEFRAIATDLAAPVDVGAPAGDDRIFAVEKAGTIRIVHADGTIGDEPFLDLRSAVLSEGNEQGLVGLTFHPEYADNGRFLVFYTDLTGDVVVAEFRVDPNDANRADPHSARVVIEVDQPNQYHNGGSMTFGPDGFLYIAFGDGGGIGDTYRNGQNPATLPGTIARIDVDGPLPYAVPGDNPFVHTEGAVEAVFWGLRNPWRMSIDPVTGLIYIGDVGQNRWEEITVLSPEEFGANLGWPIIEGFECFDGEAEKATEHRPRPCDRTGLRLPDHVVRHGGTCAIVGGHVYRGSQIPEMQGHYLYADFCGGYVRGFTMDGGIAVDHRKWSRRHLGAITTLGLDGSGEILVANTGGTIYRMTP